MRLIKRISLPSLSMVVLGAATGLIIGVAMYGKGYEYQPLFVFQLFGRLGDSTPIKPPLLTDTEIAATPFPEETRLHRGATPTQAKYNAEKYGQIGQYKLAIEELSYAVEMVPRDAEAHYELGTYHWALRQYDLALGHLDKVLELTLESDPRALRDVTLFHRALLRLETNELPSALDDLTQVIDRNKISDHQFSLAAYYRGRIYLRLLDHVNAVRDYSLAIDRYPDDVAYYWSRLEIYKTFQRWEDVVKDSSRIIELENLNKDAYIERAEAYQHLGKWQGALADYQTCLALFPYTPDRSQIEEQIRKLENSGD